MEALIYILTYLTISFVVSYIMIKFSCEEITDEDLKEFEKKDENRIQ